jgi:hypothetical protein
VSSQHFTRECFTEIIISSLIFWKDWQYFQGFINVYCLFFFQLWDDFLYFWDFIRMYYIFFFQLNFIFSFEVYWCYSVIKSYWLYLKQIYIENTSHCYPGLPVNCAALATLQLHSLHYFFMPIIWYIFRLCSVPFPIIPSLYWCHSCLIIFLDSVTYMTVV